jgi:hypothetical protein
MIRLASLVVSCSMLLAIAGCGSYYKITEPASKNVYYSKDFEKTKMGGLSFKDAKTGAIVTIQNSEIKEISRDTFEEEVKKQ